jgi:hypothetical protein
MADRRKALESQKQGSVDRSIQAKALHLPIERFCSQITARLSNLTFETKRAILREILRKIVFEGDHVRITGILPLPEIGGIAATQTNLYGRNPPSTALFAFTAPIVRDNARFRAACMANLAKANEVLAAKKRPADTTIN